MSILFSNLLLEIHCGLETETWTELNWNILHQGCKLQPKRYSIYTILYVHITVIQWCWIWGLGLWHTLNIKKKRKKGKMRYKLHNKDCKMLTWNKHTYFPKADIIILQWIEFPYCSYIIIIKKNIHFIYI